MQVVSSMTITPPEPAMLPASRRESKSMATSISSAVRILAEIPPGTTAFSLLPSRTPRAAFSMSSLKGVPTDAS